MAGIRKARAAVRFGGAAALALLAAAASAQTVLESESEMLERNTAVLQGLDRVTARVSTIEAPVGQEVGFGTLRITARTCRENPPIEPPESAAFLEIADAKPGEAAVPVFSGWMFASSPALSAMEHPVYDVWVVGCAESS